MADVEVAADGPAGGKSRLIRLEGIDAFGGQAVVVEGDHVPALAPRFQEPERADRPGAMGDEIGQLGPGLGFVPDDDQLHVVLGEQAVPGEKERPQTFRSAGGDDYRNHSGFLSVHCTVVNKLW